MIPQAVLDADGRFALAQIPSDHPGIKPALDSYIKQFKLPSNARPTAQRWFGVFEKDEILLVMGERGNGEYLEISDLYALPNKGRRAVLATYVTLYTIKKLMEAKIIKGILITVLATNRTFQRAVKRVFDKDPVAVVYVGGS